ncbi:carboxylesterase [Bacillus sp. TS-2]|nr:carboxylesterase [Bacillus sp. TS-2]
MKLVKPKDFMFEGGERAVLLLHGFTGTTADVRMIARHLQKEGYTCHAPLFEGHGVPPEQLLKTGPDEWWESAKKGYDFLKEQGYDEIAVCGLSLGGVFSLKFGYTLPVKGIIPMCAPVKPRTEESIYKGVLSYAKQYKQLEKKSEKQIEEEMEHFEMLSTESLLELRYLMNDVSEHLDHIYAPTFVVQARKDDMIDPQSAETIHKEVESEHKKLKWYENSGHSITIGPEKEQLHEDILEFLNTLDWKK